LSLTTNLIKTLTTLTFKIKSTMNLQMKNLFITPGLSVVLKLIKVVLY